MQAVLNALRLPLLLALVHLPVCALNPAAFAQWPPADAKPMFHAPKAGKAARDAATIDVVKVVITRCLRGHEVGEREFNVRILMSFAPTGMFRDLPKVVSDLNPLETQPIVDTLTKCQPFRFPPTDYATWRQLDINYEHKLLR